MTHAYREIYLSNAQSVLGDAFDYAVNTCGISGNDFVKLFTVSSVSKRMENGEPACLAGKSGIEIAREVVLEQRDRNFKGLRRNVLGVQKSIGLDGQLPITNGLLAEHTAKSLELIPLRTCRKCTIPFMRRM